jgi:hypothetical protein
MILLLVEDGFLDSRTEQKSIMSGEAASADITAAIEFPIYSQKLIDEEKLTPDLVFNVDETGLYWKKLPNCTFIAHEECSAPGFKAAKDCLSFCSVAMHQELSD